MSISLLFQSIHYLTAIRTKIMIIPNLAPEFAISLLPKARLRPKCMYIYIKLSFLIMSTVSNARNFGKNYMSETSEKSQTAQDEWEFAFRATMDRNAFLI